MNKRHQKKIAEINDAVTSSATLSDKSILQAFMAGGESGVFAAASEYAPKGEDKGQGAKITRAAVLRASAIAGMCANDGVAAALAGLAEACPEPAARGAKMLQIGDSVRLKVQRVAKDGTPKPARFGMACGFWPDATALVAQIGADEIVIRRQKDDADAQ